MRNLLGLLFGIFFGFTALAQPVTPSFEARMKSAEKAENVCLVSKYFDMQSAGLTMDQSKMVAIESCIQPDSGRMQFFNSILAPDADSPQTEAQLDAELQYLTRTAKRSLSRLVSECNTPYATKVSCLMLLDKQ